MKALIILVAFFFNTAYAGDWSLMAGRTKFGGPSDGLYWNINKENKRDMHDTNAGIRWDSDKSSGGWSWAAQYMHFGVARTNALAVHADAPNPGGYIADSGGQCVGGTCHPVIYRWIMRSTAQSVAIMGIKHYGGLSLEAGVNFFEVKTTGRIKRNEVTGDYWHFHPQRHIDLDLMFGIGYRMGPWTARYQVFWMDGPFNTSDIYEAPPIFVGHATQTLTLAYTF